jgi:ketosteroid isomerase-like protein
MPSQAAARELAERWVGAWNAHDLDGILEHYSDDVKFESPFASNFTPDGSGVISGKAALRTFFVRTLGAYPDLSFELEGAYAGVTTIAIAYRTQNGQRATEVMELDGDKIAHVTAHYASG